MRSFTACRAVDGFSLRADEDRASARGGAERAEGEETALQIRAEAERVRTVTRAEAQRDAQRLRGLGDARATEIFARSFSNDPEFYAFYRSLQAYSTSLSDGSTTMVLAPDSDFFRFFRDLRGTEGTVSGGAPSPPAPR